MTEQDLIDAQLREWPDSRIASIDEVGEWMYECPMHMDELDLWHYHTTVARWIARALLKSPRVFYECGLRPDGTYRWRGCRYGVEPSEHLSGYPSN